MEGSGYYYGRRRGIRVSRRLYKAGKSKLRERRKFPPKKFGRAFIPRGSELSLGLFGPDEAGASELQKTNRKNAFFRGKGGYSVGKFVGDVRKLLGNKVINAANNRLVSAISGTGLYGGQGSYEVNSNQLVSGGRGAPVTHATNDETDTIIFSDCEYVQDIYAPTIASGSSSYQSQTIPCNPGLPAFAPNLSQLACNYTEYEILQLIYELRPTVSESNVNNGLTGMAMMVYNYNPNDDPYDNKEDVMQAHGSVSGKITEGLRCGVECDARKTNRTKFFVRNGPVPFGRDNDEYDMGVLTIATNNIPSAFSNLQIFELWVYYTVKLRKRKAGAMRLLNQQADIFACSGDVAFGSLFNTQFITGLNGVGFSQQNNIGGALYSNAAQYLQYTFPASFNGNVEILLGVEGTGFTYGASAATVGVFGTSTLVLDQYAASATSGDSPQAVSTNGSSGLLTVIIHLKVRSAVGGTNNGFSITTGFTAGNITQWEIRIREMSTLHWTNKNKPQPLLLNLQDLTTIINP